MFNVVLFIYSVVLLFVLTPGILIKIHANKYILAFVHAVLFALIWQFTSKLVWNTFEGFETTNIKTGKLLLNATSNWKYNHKNADLLIQYIKSSYPNLANNFSINIPTKPNAPNNDTTDATLLLTDKDYPNGVSYTIPFNDNINLKNIINFLKTYGYEENTEIQIPTF